MALVHAAAGGVGQLLVQMVTAKGGRVIATAGSPDKLEVARRLGATAVIDYSQSDDLAAAVREANGGSGVDVAYDGVGKATFDASLASLRPRGMMVLFGAASGQVPPFDIQRLNQGGSLFLTRPTLGNYIATREELLERAGSVLGDLAAGRLHLEIGGRYPISDAARAYDDLEARRTTGKLLLVPDRRLPEGSDGCVQDRERAGRVDQRRVPLAALLPRVGDLGTGHDRQGDEELDADLGVVDRLGTGLDDADEQEAGEDLGPGAQTIEGRMRGSRITTSQPPTMAAMPRRCRSTSRFLTRSMAPKPRSQEPAAHRPGRQLVAR